MFKPTAIFLCLAVNTLTAQTITTFAGNGTAGFSGDGGPAAQAQINRVVGLAADSQGNVYLAEENNHRIRKVDRNGNISTYAGTGTQGFSGDGGAATQAQLNQPLGVCTDAAGNLFVNDNGNKRIRKIAASGTITTVFGTGSNVHSGDGGPATQAGAVIPIRCATDRAGNVYFVDQGSHRVRRIGTDGIVNTVGGTGAQGFSGDGGPATAAAMNNPTAIATDSSDNLYVTDQSNHRIRRIGTNGIIQTVAGNGVASFGGDGGPATAASFSFPGSIVLDAAGTLFIVDTNSARIRKVSGGTISTIAGTGVVGFAGDGGPAAQAQFNSAFAVAIDPAGNLYVGDTFNNRIRKIAGAAQAAAPPSITSASVTNAASFQTGLSPGAIITIFGTNLGARPGEILAAPGLTWPAQTGGASVLVGGLNAPVYRVLNLNGQEQISIQAPFSLAPGGTVQVVVSTAAGVSVPASVSVVAAQPGIFLLDADGAGAVHADGSIAGRANPAGRGEIVVVYLTGLGGVNNAPPSGQAAPFTTLSRTFVAPAVTIGGLNAEVSFSGLTPGFIGLYQINAQVPAGSTNGLVDLTVDANGIRSNTAKLGVR